MHVQAISLPAIALSVDHIQLLTGDLESSIRREPRVEPQHSETRAETVKLTLKRQSFAYMKLGTTTGKKICAENGQLFLRIIACHQISGVVAGSMYPYVRAPQFYPDRFLRDSP